MEITMEEHMKAIVAKSGSEAQDAGAFILEEQPIPESFATWWGAIDNSKIAWTIAALIES